MKAKIFIAVFLISITSVGFYSCIKDNNIKAPTYLKLELPEVPFNYNANQPNELITLGRVLFYDTHLSINNSVSCASCHKQIFGFSDDVAFSRGFENKVTVRNSLPIQNLSNFSFSASNLFWDGRESFLTSMVLKPITNHVEMGMTDDNSIAQRVKATPYYQDLFEKAFYSDTVSITADKIASALSAFCESIQTSNTKFDNFQQGLTSLSAFEIQGQNLFFTKYNCGSCHQSVTIPSYGGFFAELINIGLDEIYADKGLGARTGVESDNGKFKVPSLRNIALTAPYMHDGRFNSLEQVLDHYSHGIADNVNLDVRLKGTDNLPMQMNISVNEKMAIIAFLNTLTDYTMISDIRFSTPFVIQ